MNAKKVEEADTSNDLDYVLSDVGEFGKHQIGHFILMIFPIILCAIYGVEFIVTSSTDDYRQVDFYSYHFPPRTLCHGIYFGGKFRVSCKDSFTN